MPILLFDYLYYASKGHVLSVIGNHDFASLQQDYRYVSNQDLVYRKTLGLFNRDNLFYNVVLSRPFIILFNNFTISHAGLTDKIISKYIKIKTADLRARGIIENNPEGDPNTQKAEIDLTMFANEVNNFNFYNKDLSYPELWDGNKPPQNSIYRNILFNEVINDLIWNLIGNDVPNQLNFQTNISTYHLVLRLGILLNNLTRYVHIGLNIRRMIPNA